MIKKRPAIVVSRQKTNYSTTTVVPLSTQRDKKNSPYVICLGSDYDPQGQTSWAKCNMLQVVSNKRLDRTKFNNVYVVRKVSAFHLNLIDKALAKYLDIKVIEKEPKL